VICTNMTESSSGTGSRLIKSSHLERFLQRATFPESLFISYKSDIVLSYSDLLKCELLIDPDN
jgi:hypothetical protein